MYVCVEIAVSEEGVLNELTVIREEKEKELRSSREEEDGQERVENGVR